jgi:hypothetical protein
MGFRSRGVQGMSILAHFFNNQLNWLPELGIGYFPVKESPYDAAYFAKYQEMSKTGIGLALQRARVHLVNKYTKADVLDIGIGSGLFLCRHNTYGYDINPVAVEYLIKHRLYRHPMRGATALTFWDSLEHIHDPSLHLQGAKEYVFVSCPIYENSEHILRSKHFRKDEHCWYWTEHGLITFMRHYGFELVESNRMESEIGREDIGTFFFHRIK